MARTEGKGKSKKRGIGRGGKRGGKGEMLRVLVDETWEEGVPGMVADDDPFTSPGRGGGRRIYKGSEHGKVMSLLSRCEKQQKQQQQQQQQG